MKIFEFFQAYVFLRYKRGDVRMAGEHQSDLIIFAKMEQDFVRKAGKINRECHRIRSRRE